jgi:hypothetical protein
MSHTIIRARRRHRFVIVDQRAVEDTRLSWAARGLLGYLLSRPDDWKVLVKDLQRRGDLGRDAVYKLLKELRAAGYLRFEQARDRQGRIRGGTYYVHETPSSLYPDLPDTVRPDTAAPDPVKPEALLKTELNLIPTTTTTTTNNNKTKDHCCGSGSGEKKAIDLEFPASVPQEFQPSAQRLVEGLEKTVAQQVIDDWAGIIAAGAIHPSPLGCLRRLVKRAQGGTFSPECAIGVPESQQVQRPQDQLKSRLRTDSVRWDQSLKAIRWCSA